MPYPVLPPLPPVANVVLSEVSRGAQSSLDAAVASDHLQSEAGHSVCLPKSCETSLSSANLFNASSFKTAPESGTAKSLGDPQSIGLAELKASASATSTAAFLPLPDLDALGQQNFTVSSGAVLPQSVLPQSTAPRLAQTTPAPSTVPSQSGDSIRLDLPTSGQTPSAAPNPVPDPTGGQILTIPTPDQPEQQPQQQNQPNTGQSNPQQPNTGQPNAGQSNPQAPNRSTRRGRRGREVPIDPQAVGEVLEVRGNRQEYDEQQQIFTAEGKVEVRFRQAVLTADRVQVNIPNRVAVAEGNAILTRGDQVLRGERFNYNFGLNQGNILTARGELVIPSAGRDFNPVSPDELDTASLRQPITERVSATQPLQVAGGRPGPAFGYNPSGNLQAGTLTRLRFEADQAQFEGQQVQAQNVRITNDPFSPPELELRSNQVTYRRLSPTSAEIVARNPRLVFDRGFELPLLVNRIVLDNRRRNSGLLSFGYDERDRDGFYIERAFDVYSSPFLDFSLTPQILVQRAIQEGSFPSADQFGLIADLNINISPFTSARAVASFSSLDFGDIQDSLRASFRAQHVVFNHTVSFEYSYRNRLFNGSLGFQDIQSSLGVVVASPRYVLGRSLINLNYQASVQYINAQTDRRSLYPTNRDDRDLRCIPKSDRDTTGNGCADLTRYQAAVTLSRLFYLWFGKPLPPTPTEGLRYSPISLTPYLGVLLSTRGVYSGYSNGSSQSGLTGTVTLLGQFGHFSRPFLDYTAFNISYSKIFKDGNSPFLFDRIADQQTISAGLTQQIYGPLRFGIQASYNVDNGDSIDTLYTLEYVRRTYSIRASYSTGRRAAALTFSLNDFNWTGDPGPFSGLGSSTIQGGVIQENN
jgi:hypothetical protein